MAHLDELVGGLAGEAFPSFVQSKACVALMEELIGGQEPRRTLPCGQVSTRKTQRERESEGQKERERESTKKKERQRERERE